jgi:FAD/FMN-containing dehydrogenase
VISTNFASFNEDDLAYLKQLVGDSNVTTDESELLVQSNDAFPGEWVKPDVVVWPESPEQVSRVVKYVDQRRIPITPRAVASQGA